MGVPEDDKDVAPVLSGEVRDLAKMIDKHTRSGLPLTEIAQLLSERRQMDREKEDFRKWITKLEITENERRLINSIVEQRRVGTIMFEDAKTGDDIFEFTIPDDTSETSSTPVWALNFERFLRDAIQNSTSGKIKIWFEAKN